MNQETSIVQCGECGARNRVPPEKTGKKAKCGKCGAIIDTAVETENRGKSRDAGNVYLVRCVSCGAKNRVPEAKMEDVAHCGKCKAPVETAGLLSGKSIMTSDRDFEAKVLKSPLPVLFFAFANWCPSCRSVIPAVEELASEWRGRVRVAKINVDQNPMTASRFNIMSVPTIIVFDNGQARERLTGAATKLQIVKKTAPYIQGP